MRTYCIAPRTQGSVATWMKGKSNEDGIYIYTSSWFTSLYRRNEHDIVKQLDSNKNNLRNSIKKKCLPDAILMMSMAFSTIWGCPLPYIQALHWLLSFSHLAKLISENILFSFLFLFTDRFNIFCQIHFDHWDFICEVSISIFMSFLLSIFFAEKIHP